MGLWWFRGFGFEVVWFPKVPKDADNWLLGLRIVVHQFSSWASV